MEVVGGLRRVVFSTFQDAGVYRIVWVGDVRISGFLRSQGV